MRAASAARSRPPSHRGPSRRRATRTRICTRCSGCRRLPSTARSRPAIYARASDVLETALHDRSWTAALEQTGAYQSLPPAVILDLDETVLDNSASRDSSCATAPHIPKTPGASGCTPAAPRPSRRSGLHPRGRGARGPGVLRQQPRRRPTKATPSRTCARSESTQRRYTPLERRARLDVRQGPPPGASAGPTAC